MSEDRIIEIGARALAEPDEDTRWTEMTAPAQSHFRVEMRNILNALAAEGLVVVDINRLHAKIMNLPTPEFKAALSRAAAYEVGFRDARHAAAESVMLAAAQEQTND